MAKRQKTADERIRYHLEAAFLIARDETEHETFRCLISGVVSRGVFWFATTHDDDDLDAMIAREAQAHIDNRK